jgi:hypothetical protein
MKKLKKYIVLLFYVASILLISCNKDTSDTVSQFDLLTKPIWKITGHTVEPGYDMNGDGVIDTDIYLYSTECEKASTIKFYSDGNVIHTISCNSVLTTKWSLGDKPDNKQLFINYQEYPILELSETTLKISYTKISTHQTDIYTYTAQ